VEKVGDCKAEQLKTIKNKGLVPPPGTTFFQFSKEDQSLGLMALLSIYP
jgi:hypothetical protein